LRARRRCRQASEDNSNHRIVCIFDVFVSQYQKNFTTGFWCIVVGHVLSRDFVSFCIPRNWRM